jgi:hypothetical protein
VRLYDAIQGDFNDIAGGFISGSRVKKAWNTSALFFMNHAGEHEMQVSTMFAALDAQKLQTTSGENISLFDAYILDEDGKLTLRDDVTWTTKQRMDFMNRIHAVNKSLHGNYNDFDKTLAQKHAVGRLVLMFRKFIYPGVRRRFAGTRYDTELGEIHEGMFITTFRLLRDETHQLKKFLLFKENGLTELEKANVKRTLVEVGTLIAVTAMYGMAAGFLDDEKDNWAASLLLYEIRRFQTELGFYMKPGEALKILKSPAASMTIAERVVRLMDQLIYTALGDYDHTHYKQASHGHKKGDSKLWDATKDLIPVIQGIERSKHPEDAIKFFDKLF